MKADETLRPLWCLTTGVVVGAAAGTTAPVAGPQALHLVLVAAGAAAVLAALIVKNRRAALLWLLAGVSIASGRSLGVASERIHLQHLLDGGESLNLRVEARVLEGWSPTRWGLRSTVRIGSASLRGARFALPARCPVEVRGEPRIDDLPAPGTLFEALVAIRGDASRPLLVASSARLLKSVSEASGVPHLRNRVAVSLLRAAGTDVHRIQAADLAAALGLGRRDLMPRGRKDGWRRSGLAHLLAVSGLHVGLLGGCVWLAALAAGFGPTAARWAVLLSLPAYAVLTGAQPSALRAATMGVVYLAARLAGRPLVPMAAVLLTAIGMLVVQPALIADVGFQLTVFITAALVRWVPDASRALRGPLWLRAAIAVPVVAQIAAMPIVAWHFRTMVPGAALANLIVVPLLAPVLLLSIAAALTAPLWPMAGSMLLLVLGHAQDLLWWCGAIGRGAQVVTPPVPVIVVLALVLTGWLALRPTRVARAGAAMWLLVMGVTSLWWAVRPGPTGDTVTLLPVGSGTAVILRSSAGATVLCDGGAARDEASLLLAEIGARRLRAVLASHPDSDHIGGLQRVISAVRVDELVMPAWMLGDAEVVPLLRSARRRGTRVRTVNRGSRLQLADTTIDVLWPPPHSSSFDENDRSLVALLDLGPGRVLLPADAGKRVERRLAATSDLRSQVLVVAHHGSSSSTSRELLDACVPEIALVPAGPRNTHFHPRPDVLQKLEERRIPVRYPARDGWCGAEYSDGAWRAFP